jgi:hypothetical protein
MTDSMCVVVMVRLSTVFSKSKSGLLYMAHKVHKLDAELCDLV